MGIGIGTEKTPVELGARIEKNVGFLHFASPLLFFRAPPLDNKSGKLAVAAIAYDPGNGRTLEVSTTEPGVQFYTSNHMEGTVPGKQGKTYSFRTAFCLETEHFPDSPNHPSFPSTELKARAAVRHGHGFQVRHAPKLSTRHTLDL